MFEPHRFLGDGDFCDDCGQRHDDPIHTDADGRSPLAHDAGETQQESQPARAKGWKRHLTYGTLDKGARADTPFCDADIESLTGLRWSHLSAARNGLCIDGHVAPILDPDGMTHPLKWKIDGKRITVSHGPWRTKPNPRGKGRVIVWVPTYNPEYGGFRGTTEEM
jgi:hypothetical protein